MTIELVTWRDAYFETDQEKKRKDYPVRTVGWVKETKRFLVVRSEKLPKKEGYRAITFIPLENVLNRKALS